MSWAVFQVKDAIHIAPEGDIKEHEFFGPCWCGARTDWPNSMNRIHRAFLPLGTAKDDVDDGIDADEQMTEH